MHMQRCEKATGAHEYNTSVSLTSWTAGMNPHSNDDDGERRGLVHGKAVKLLKSAENFPPSSKQRL